MLSSASFKSCLASFACILGLTSVASASSFSVATYAQAVAGSCVDGGVLPTTTGGSSASCTTLVGASADASALALSDGGHLAVLAGADAIWALGAGQPSAHAGATAIAVDGITVLNSGLFFFETFATGLSSVTPCGDSGNVNNEVQATFSIVTPNGTFGFGPTPQGYASCTTGALSDTLSMTLDLSAGAQLSWFAELDAAASVQADNVTPNVTSISDASHSMHIYLTPLTAGASYISDSGFDYSRPDTPSPTPEPSSLLMLGTGVLVLASKIRARLNFMRSTTASDPPNAVLR
jgi:hypothetical protein